MNKKTQLILLVPLAGLALGACDPEPIEDDPGAQIEVPEGYSLVWSDEFDGETIDADIWQYEIGDGTDYGLPAGWGNNELQLYSNSSENAGIMADGDASVLFIQATTDGAGGYTSAKLTTQGLKSVQFGRVDVMAKLPEGQGVWPAIWMLGDNIDQVDWPGCGEIDIVEMLGHQPQQVYSTVHYTDSDNSHGEIQGSLALSEGTFADAYHLFSVAWTPESLTFSVDGEEVRQVTIEDDMKEFLRSFYLILNVAVGGYWPGNPDASTSFPQALYVDYVRVFSLDGFTAPAAPALDLDEETVGQNIDASLVAHAVQEGFNDLGSGTIVSYGGGGEPLVSASDVAVDGDSSLVFAYPGGNWGGGYIELDNRINLSQYSFLKFSLHQPATLADAEIKLESPSTNAAVFLTDYTGVDVGEGFVEYTIPLTDFLGLDVSELTIPFALWNPKDVSDNFVEGEVLIDNLYFTE